MKKGWNIFQDFKEWALGVHEKVMREHFITRITRHYLFKF